MCDIIVSVICNVYNHEKYIRHALDGFIMQKTNFEFEILIHDDASSDNSANIIREYEVKYPNIVKAIYQKENQYSQGKRITELFQLSRAKGKYIAICEGDDYWTDPYKLQKQVDALEKSSEVDICTHAATTYKNGKVNGKIAPMKENGIIIVDDVIRGGGGFVATNSLMYRREILKKKPEFYKMLSFDYSLQIFGSLRGGMLYLADDMSVYREQTEGSWTRRMRSNASANITHLERVKHMLEQLNTDTNFKYVSAIQERKLLIDCNILVSEGRYIDIFKNKELNKVVPFRTKVKLICKWVYTKYKAILKV